MIKLFSGIDFEASKNQTDESLEYEDKVVDFGVRRTTSEAEHDLLISEYSDAESAFAKIPYYFKKINDSRNELRDARNELIEKNAALNKELRFHKESVARLENETLELKERETNLNVSIEQEKRGVKALEDFRLNADADIREYKTRIHEADKKLEKLVPLARKLEREKDILDNNLRKLISEKTILDKSNSDCEGNLQKAREEISNLETKCEFLEKTKSDLEQKLDSTRQDLSDKEAEVRAHEKRSQSANKKIDQLSMEIAALRKENEHIVHAREESNRALNNELESVRTRTRALEGILEQARTRSKIDSKRTAEVRKENVQLTLDISQKDIIINSINEQLSEAGARAQVSSELQSEMDTRQAELLEKNKKLQDDLDSANEHAANLLVQKETLDAMIESIQQDFGATTTMFEKRLKALENENSELRNEARRLERLNASEKVEPAADDKSDKVVPIKSTEK